MIWWIVVSFLLGMALGVISGYISYRKLWTKHEHLRQRMREL